MRWQLQQDEQGLHLKLGESLLIQDLAQLHEEVSQAWAEPQALYLDLEEITEIDTAGLQWLIFLHRWGHQRQQTPEIVAASDPLTELVALFQAEALLGLTTLIPAQGA